MIESAPLSNESPAPSKAANPRTILIITDPYYPDEVAAGYFITKIAEGLAQNYNVEVLCGQPNYRTRGIRAPTRETLNGVKIQRLRSTTFSNDSIPLRLINIATFALSLFFKAFATLRSRDLVLVVTTPPMLPFVARPACALRGAKCLLLVHDVFPEALSAAGLTTPSSWVSKILSRMVRSLYRWMDGIIVIGRDMQKLVSAKRGPSTKPIAIIPNWADVEEIHPTEGSLNPLLQKLGLAEKFVVQYSGNMGRTHNLEATLTAAEMLHDDPTIHFLLIGGGKKKRMVEDALQQRGLTNVTLLDYQPREQLPVSLNACDIAIIPFVSSMAGISVPSRMYNVLGSGKPILAVTEVDSELAMVVVEEQVGWVIDPDQPEKIADAIRIARAHPETLAEMGRRARCAAEEKYTLPHVVRQFDEVVQRLAHTD